MMIDSDWQAHLQAAAEALERTPGAPDWLQKALRNALAVAPDLAPAPEAEPEPPTFFYPH